MEKKIKVFEFRSNQGNVIFSIHMFDKEIVPGKPQPPPKPNNPPPKKKESKENKKQDHKPGNNNHLMSQAQRRYIFRLLAEQGTEKEDAHNYLIQYFQVESLKDVTKYEASRMIEYLLKETEGGDKNDRSSIQ